MLTCLVSRARGPKIAILKCLYTDPNLSLPLAPKPNVEQQSLQQQQQVFQVNNNQLTAYLLRIRTARVDITSTMATTQNVSESAELPSDSTPVLPVVTERFLLYEFFRAPGIRYHSNGDLRNEEKQQQQPNVSVSGNEKKAASKELDYKKEEDEHDISQYSPSNIPRTTIQNETQVNYEEWSDMPYMKANFYGYRLGSAKEIELLKNGSSSSVERTCISCFNCCSEG
ncbi:unnamed protein product [Rotaria sp. Silwood2]|nr:unnamed protein product [Rotaria sp. Silwood2]CAF4027524.1 unnamed protein product [Rotaria sp. Silwood2]